MDTQTRHALKHDRLVDATRTSVNWFEENRSKVIQAAVAAVVLLGIVIAGLVVYSQRSTAANLAFGQAMDTYNAPLATAGKMKNHAPVLLAHGEADQVVPAFRSRDAEAALRTMNVPVETAYVANLGHGIDDVILDAGAQFLRKAFAG